MKQIHGIFAVTVTHFQENGEIDYAACAKHINWLIESGVHGLLPLGATGEFSALTLEERKAFAEFAMKEVAGRVPVSYTHLDVYKRQPRDRPDDPPRPERLPSARRALPPRYALHPVPACPFLTNGDAAP